MTIRFVSWDFRTPPTAEHLAAEITAVGARPVYAAPVDAGTDDYILALSDESITPQQAYERWVSQP